jgi:hypothetical protein
VKIAGCSLRVSNEKRSNILIKVTIVRVLFRRLLLL